MRQDIIQAVRLAVTEAANSFNNASFAYFVEVEEFDGYYITAKFSTGENEFGSIKNVPIVQSPYIAPVAQAGDFGILLNINNDLGAYLEGKENAARRGSTGGTFYVYLPLLKKEQLLSDATTVQITSLDKESTQIKIDDSGVAASIKEKLTIDAGNVEETIKEKYSIESNDVSIIGKNPVEIGTSAGALNDAFTAVMDTIDALKNAAMVMGQATLTWMPTYDTAKSAAEQKISQIVK